jgi:hypothetical protein
MSPTEQHSSPEEARSAEASASSEERLRAEGRATWSAIVIAIVIAVFAAPCLCYFGGGLFQGLKRIGTPLEDPSKTPYRQPAPRDPKYDRVFERPDPDAADAGSTKDVGAPPPSSDVGPEPKPPR